MSQSHGSTLWREAAGSGAVPSAIGMVLRTEDTDACQHSTAVDAQAIAVDPGDGSATIFDLTAEHFAVDDGHGGFHLSATGPAAAVLVDTDGVLTLTPVGDGVVQGGRFLADSSGAIYPIRYEADAFQFVALGGVIRPY